MKYFLTILLITILSSFNSEARSFRAGQMPNGVKFQCSNCHFNPGGGGARTPFGEDVLDNLSSPVGNASVRWDLIWKLDSDGDGFTNGEELQDPTGKWRTGDPQPGDNALVTNPGDAGDFPTSVEAIARQYFEINRVFPIPFENDVNFDITLKKDGVTELIITNSKGQFVDRVENKFFQSGEHQLSWSGTDVNGIKVTPGLYYFTIRQNNAIIRRKLLKVQ